MTDKSWELLTKLIDACGYNIAHIEDEFDFDELCDDIRRRLSMVDKEIIDNQKKTIHRLRDECDKLKAERNKIKEIGDNYFDEFEMCCLDLPDAIDSLLKRYDNAFIRLKKIKENEGNL